uniref:Uncharacterized protein n=1 Tax=Triticum urartu TaxID=4572 RepID=A0A8R7R4T7_TRIUA
MKSSPAAPATSGCRSRASRRYAALISPPVAPARSPSTSYSVHLPAGAADATATAHRTDRRELEQAAAWRNPASAGLAAEDCITGGGEIMTRTHKSEKRERRMGWGS